MAATRKSKPDAASPEPDVETVADELYGLLPDEFIAARTKAEKAARAAGDRDAAAAIKALGKPTVVAWLANQLVRTHRDEVTPLLELGAALREATRSLSGEQLRTLSQQQHQVIVALVRQARTIAKDAGQQVTEATASGLEETLRAALADEDLAQQLAAGHLTSGLQYVGFGLTGGGSPAPTKRPAPQGQSRAAELREAEQAVETARAEAERSFDAERHARSARDDAQAAARTAAEKVDALRAQLSEAEAHQQTADQAADEALEAYDAAAGALEEARAALAEAEHRCQELQDS